MRNRNPKRNWRSEPERDESERYTPAYSEFENEYSDEFYNPSEYNEREYRPGYNGNPNYRVTGSYGRYGESTRSYRGGYEGGQRQSPYGAGYQRSEYEEDRGYGSSEDTYERERSGRASFGREEEFGGEDIYGRRRYEQEERESGRYPGYPRGVYSTGRGWRSERERGELPGARRIYGDEIYSTTTGRGRNRERSWEKQGRVGARRARREQY